VNAPETRNETDWHALRALEARCASIGERLETADSAEALAACKREIIGLFREVDALHDRVGALRERIRTLVTTYKSRTAPSGDLRGRPPVYTDSLNSSSFMERGWNFIAAEKHEEAVTALEQALALSPGNLDAEGLLGWALMKSGRLDRAMDSLRRVLAAQPSNEMARVNLGFICLEKKMYGEAAAHLQGALELGHDRKATLYALLYLGLLHAAREEPEQAVAFLKRAIETGPNLIEGYYHLGIVFYRTGRKEQARAVWESAVARNRYNPFAKKAQALLEELDAGRQPAFP
jgi:tetratricopeptide (TPR) repeat protein